MDFETELMEYITKSEQRGNKVISIAGVKAIHARHALRNAHQSLLQEQDAQIVHLDSWRAVEVSRGLRVYDHKEVR